MKNSTNSIYNENNNIILIIGILKMIIMRIMKINRKQQSYK